MVGETVQAFANVDVSMFKDRCIHFDPHTGKTQTIGSLPVTASQIEALQAAHVSTSAAELRAMKFKMDRDNRIKARSVDEYKKYCERNVRTRLLTSTALRQ